MNSFKWLVPYLPFVLIGGLIIWFTLRKICSHTWDHCKCRKCGKMRDTDHHWDDCICLKCGKKRHEQHTWEGCKCKKCGDKRNENHSWYGCKCTICGETRDLNHAWDGCKCTRCGSKRDQGHIWSDITQKCKRCGRIKCTHETHESVFIGICSFCGGTELKKRCNACGHEWYSHICT